MAELKIGGSDVKIMYGSQEIGGGHKSGDIVFSASSDFDTIRQYTAPYKPSKDDEYKIHIVYINKNGVSTLKHTDATPDDISSINFPGGDFKFAINSNGELSGSCKGLTRFIVVVVLN